MGREGGWWAEDTNRRRTITSLWPSAADGVEGGGAGRPSLQRAARKLQRWEDGGQLSDHEEAEEGGTPAVLRRSSCDNAMKLVGFRKSNHT